MTDGEFTLFLRLSARRKDEDSTIAGEIASGQDARGPETDPQSLARPVMTEITLDRTLFNKIMKNIEICVKEEDGWLDDAVYGGLIVIRDSRQLEPSLFDYGALETLYDAMDSRRPFRVRKAAYDVMLATQDQSLKSTMLRQKLKELDFLRRLQGVVTEIARSEYQRSFLVMIGDLSEDGEWQPYLRNAVDIWLPFRHEGPIHALRILSNIGGLLLPGRNGSAPPSPDKTLEKWVEEEWAGVPARPVSDLTVDRLRPLVEITEQFMELSFNESNRKDILSMVEQVVRSLEKRRDDGYKGPGEVRDIVHDLEKKLRLPPSPATRRRSTYNW